jgi:DNA polymerase III delta subunit
MKLNDLPSAYRTLASLQEPYPILAIEGTDDFFREDCAERYKEFWKKRFPQGLLHSLSSQDVLSGKGHLQAGPSLFEAKPLYIIDEVSSVKGKKCATLASMIHCAIEDAYFLLIGSETIPKEIIAEAESNGAVFLLPQMKPWDRQPFLVSWIQAFVKKREKVLDKDGASMLAQAYSSDRSGLIQELEKLCTYRLNEPSIALQDVEEIGTIDLQPTMWQLLDGLLAGDTKAVVHCLVESSDMNDIAVLRFVKNQLERLLVAIDAGTPPRNKAQERQLAVVRKRGVRTIVEWVNRLKMQEVAIRSGLEENEEGSLLPFFLSLCMKNR